MKRAVGFDLCMPQGRKRSIQGFVVVAFLFLILVNVEMPFMFDSGDGDMTLGDGWEGSRGNADTLQRDMLLETASPEEEGEDGGPDSAFRVRVSPPAKLGFKTLKTSISGDRIVSGLIFDANMFNNSDNDGLQKAAKSAWEFGVQLWDNIQSGKLSIDSLNKVTSHTKESCPNSISLSGDEFANRGKILVLPCGLTLGSHITVVGKPRFAHPKTGLVRKGVKVKVTQFVLELQGLKIGDAEDPPKILHLNPRLKGDWSGKPVIELNSCYRMQWGTAQRCDGLQSNAREETGKNSVGDYN